MMMMMMMFLLVSDISAGSAGIMWNELVTGAPSPEQHQPVAVQSSLFLLHGRSKYQVGEPVSSCLCLKYQVPSDLSIDTLAHLNTCETTTLQHTITLKRWLVLKQVTKGQPSPYSHPVPHTHESSLQVAASFAGWLSHGLDNCLHSGTVDLGWINPFNLGNSWEKCPPPKHTSCIDPLTWCVSICYWNFLLFISKGLHLRGRAHTKPDGVSPWKNGEAPSSGMIHPKTFWMTQGPLLVYDVPNQINSFASSQLMCIIDPITIDSLFWGMSIFLLSN